MPCSGKSSRHSERKQFCARDSRTHGELATHTTNERNGQNMSGRGQISGHTLRLDHAVLCHSYGHSKASEAYRCATSTTLQLSFTISPMTCPRFQHYSNPSIIGSRRDPRRCNSAAENTISRRDDLQLLPAMAFVHKQRSLRSASIFLRRIGI